jgi:CRISPR-associated protein Csd2
MEATSKPIANRYDFVYLFDVTEGNPNGDPDAGNQPRIDPETGHGLVTDVCQKRKIRNFVTITKRNGDGPAPGHDIYVKERGILANEQRRAYVARELKASDRPNDDAREWMCQTFYDVRTFGAVMTTGKIEGDDKTKFKEYIDPKVKKPQWNCGQVRGPVQITFARSIDPILTLEHAITRVALTNVSDTGRAAAAEEGDEKAASGQIGRKTTVPYGLYRSHGFVSPHLAAQTGFSENDLELLWQSLKQMFEHDHSSSRGEMVARRLIVFKHESSLGNAPAHKLFERVRVRARHKPTREYGHYEVTVDKTVLPSGVEIIEML